MTNRIFAIPQAPYYDIEHLSVVPARVDTSITRRNSSSVLYFRSFFPFRFFFATRRVRTNIPKGKLFHRHVVFELVHRRFATCFIRGDSRRGDGKGEEGWLRLTFDFFYSSLVAFGTVLSFTFRFTWPSVTSRIIKIPRSFDRGDEPQLFQF